MSGIVGGLFDLSGITSCDYSNTQTVVEVLEGVRTTERLVTFVTEYISSLRDAFVICENWAAVRQTYEWPFEEPQPPPVCYFGDNEVYTFVSSEVSDRDVIEDVVRPYHHWQTGVCSACHRVPTGEIPDEAFLDEIVENTRHIFLPRDDNSGNLISSPTMKGK